MNIFWWLLCTLKFKNVCSGSSGLGFQYISMVCFHVIKSPKIHSFLWKEEIIIFKNTFIYLFIFSFIFISWRLITLQYHSGFCHTLTWISHGFTCIPHPDPPSHLLPYIVVFICLLSFINLTIRKITIYLFLHMSIYI